MCAGSDPDAGLYWMARMLEGGEDARFLARRLVILASEDIGLADPRALLIADAAARAVEFVGLPEAVLNLAQAVVYLATAPKSNRVTVALTAPAGTSARRGGRRTTASAGRPLPWGGRDRARGGVRYPHDEPTGWVPQQYRPEELEGHVYYEPSDHGDERRVAERLRPRNEAE